jgi:hypothetical protein
MVDTLALLISHGCILYVIYVFMRLKKSDKTKTKEHE